MHFPKYWTRVARGGVTAWGWSDESAALADDDGQRRVGRIVEWLKGGMAGELGRYGYPDRPMREEVLREFHRGEELVAVVSRNSYGCAVLNTTDAFFIDVDEPQASLSSLVTSLFRGKKKLEPTVVNQIEQWVAASPEWGWRLYRTAAGLRLLATQAPIGPDDADCERAFDAFGADRLYRRLCSNQRCFRARLTPKPWRCGVGKLPNQARWPWSDAEAEASFQRWQGKYEELATGVATCQLVGQFGNQVIHPDLQGLVAFHDEATRAAAGLEMA
ncbi:MAG: hypothetical protein ACR2RV_17285 [Verrucomicrobiales bacterium]